MFLYSINSIVVEKQYSDDLYYKNQMLLIFELYEKYTIISYDPFEYCIQIL